MKAERDLEHRREAGAGFQGELTEIAEERARLQEESTGIEERRAGFKAAEVEAQNGLSALQAQLHAAAERRDVLQEDVAKARVDLATSEERREALRNHIAHLQRQEDDLLRQHDERQGRLDSLQQRRTDLQETVTSSTAQHAAAEEHFNTLSSQLEALLKERDDIRISTEEERQRQTKLQTELRTAERQQADHERQAGEITVRRDALCERMREDYQVDLAQSFENYERPDDLDLPAIRRDLSETETALNRLGPVNLAAIDELKEVEARRDFLVGHHTDLQMAQETLSDIIDHINTESRRKFMKTYKNVRRGFQDLFRKLYGGGKADMVLQLDEGNDDPLEAGIEIIAQPPGKQPKSITLLSGGEKALTAIALLFAVYQTKPSPFCILDEVDAPLDESNTDVYCQMVKEFCDKSQFLVITHNKRTMQYADAIYGITQYERGISTKISVKLDDIESVGEDGNVDTIRGQGPFAEAAP
jgi:chromosome segregation protein